MAMTVAVAEAMETARAAAGRLGGINFSYRNVAAFRFARELIAGRGIAQVSTNGDLQVFKVPEFQSIAIGRVLGVPFQVWIMLVIVIVSAFVLHKTVFGRQVLAVGGNEAAARLSGVPVGRVKFLVYFVSGLCSGDKAPAIAMSEPTDRSIPPVAITRVIPTPTMTMVHTCVRFTASVWDVAKLGVTARLKMTSRTRARPTP